MYTPTILNTIYTNRDSLRLNKIRNKKEYAYDNHDWRGVTEEDEMEVDEVTGEFVHPVHEEGGGGSGENSISSGPVVQTYSSALGGYSSSTNRVIVHRTKRMRMFYP